MARAMQPSVSNVTEAQISLFVRTRALATMDRVAFAHQNQIVRADADGHDRTRRQAFRRPGRDP